MAEGGAGGKEVGRISIRVVPNTDRFREELKAKLDEIEGSLKAKVHVDVDLDRDGATEKMRLLLAELKAEAAKNIKVKVDVDVDRHRLRNDLGRIGSDVGGGGGRAVGGGFGGGLGSIGNFGSPANAIAILSLLPPALAIVAPAIASLPALLSAVALPIGTLALGMDGLKKAAEDAGVAVAGKKGKLSVAGALKQLQDGVSGVFEKGFTPILNQLVSVAPQVTTALKGVAQGIVNLAQGAVNALVSPGAQNQLNTLSANVGGLLSAAAPGLQSFTTGLINLATQVSTHFPGLAKWFNELGDKFSGWVSKISGDGTLDKAISGMKPVLDAIVSFVGRLMDAGIKLAADPTMQANIEKLLNSITDLTVKALPDLTNFFNALAPLIANIVKFLPAGHDPVLNPARDSHGNPLPPGQVDRNDPNIVPGSRNSFFPGIRKGSPLDTFPKWMDEHIGGPMSRFFQGKTENQQGFGGSNSTFGKTTNALGNFFTGNSQWEHSASKAIGGGVDSIAKGAKGIGNDIGGALNGIDAEVGKFGDKLGAAASKAWSKFTEAAKNSAKAVMDEVHKLPGQITGALSSLAGALEGVGRNMMQGLVNGIKSMANSVISSAKGVVNDAINGAKSLLGIHSPSTVFHGIGVNTMQGLENGLNEGAGSAIDRAKTLSQSIAAALSGGLDGVNGKAVSKQVQDLTKELQIQQDQLRVQEHSLPKGDKAGRQGIKDQLAQIQSVRDQLKLQSDQLGFNLPKDGKGGKDGASSDSMTEAAQYITQGLAKMIDSAKAFAMSNIQQFEGDLGIGGKGAIPVIATAGIDWMQGLVNKQINGAFGLNDKQGGDTHIHVNSVDEAMAVKKNEENKKALQYTRR